MPTFENSSLRNLELLQQLFSVSENEAMKWAQARSKVLLSTDPSYIAFPNGQLIAFTSVNVLARLFPLITDLDISLHGNVPLSIEPPLGTGTTLSEAIHNLVIALKPNVNVSFVSEPFIDYDCVLSVGNSSVRNDSQVFVTSDGWVSTVSSEEVSNDFSDGINPVGACLSACLGCGEVFKQILRKKSEILELPETPYDPRKRIKYVRGEFRFSSYDYGVNRESDNPPLPNDIDLGQVFVAGVGAGGGAAAYCLASALSPKGTLYLIDPDEISYPNLNRHIFATSSDAELKEPKVTAAARMFGRKAALTIKTFHGSYQDFAVSWAGKKMDILVSTVDNDQTRRAIQWDLPRIILDAATEHATDCYVKRVKLGEGLCLHCSHPPSQETIDQTLSASIGLPLSEIAALDSTNAPFEQRHVESMRESCAKHGILPPVVGQHFSDWVRESCAQMKLGERQNISIPAPHTVVFAGVLIAGEIIKERCFPDAVLNNYFSYDGIALVEPWMRLQLAPIPNCPVCSDTAVLGRYREKYD